jgi:drug/metabolite transporter (DMT)-like permease
LAAITGALAVIFNKQAAAKVHHSKMCTYYTIANVVFSPLWSFLQQRQTYPIYDWTLFLYILGIGLAFYGVQMLMTKSFKFITAGMAGILIYIAVPIGYILDYAFLGTRIGLIEIIGACIIVSSNVIIGFLLYKGVIS